MRHHELTIVCESDKPGRETLIRAALEHAHVKVQSLTRRGNVVTGCIAFRPEHGRKVEETLEAIVDINLFQLNEIKSPTTPSHPRPA